MLQLVKMEMLAYPLVYLFLMNENEMRRRWYMEASYWWYYFCTQWYYLFSTIQSRDFSLCFEGWYDTLRLALWAALQRSYTLLVLVYAYVPLCFYASYLCMCRYFYLPLYLPWILSFTYIYFLFTRFVFNFMFMYTLFCFILFFYFPLLF